MSKYYKAEYQALSRDLNKFDEGDRLLVLARLVYLRTILNISSTPRNMDGWAARTTKAKNYPGTTAPSLI